MNLDAIYKWMLLVSALAGCLSIAGSFSIIRRILKEHKRGCYNRLMISLSCFDMLNAILPSLSAILLPSELTEFSWAIGNSQSCIAQAFFYQLATSAVLYNGALSFFFLAVIKFGASEKTLSKYIEPWLHVVAIGYPLGTALYGLFKGIYEPMHVIPICYLNKRAEIFIFKGLPQIITILSLLLNNLIIFIHVRGKVKRSERYSVRGNTSINSYCLTGSIARSKNSRVRLVASQAFFYVGSFILTNIWFFVLINIFSTHPGEFEKKPRPTYLLALQFLTRLFICLQGFWNALIFARPRYLKYVRRRTVTKTQISRVRAFWWALFGPQHDKRIPAPGKRGDAFCPNDSKLANFNARAIEKSSRSFTSRNEGNELSESNYDPTTSSNNDPNSAIFDNIVLHGESNEVSESNDPTASSDDDPSSSTLEYSGSFGQNDLEIGKHLSKDEIEEEELSNSSSHSASTSSKSISNI